VYWKRNKIVNCINNDTHWKTKRNRYWRQNDRRKYKSKPRNWINNDTHWKRKQNGYWRQNNKKNHKNKPRYIYQGRRLNVTNKRDKRFFNMNMEIVDHIIDGKEVNIVQSKADQMAMSIYENNNILRIGSKVMKEQLNKLLWIADTGSTKHISFVREGFINLKKSEHILHFAHKKSQMDSIFEGTFKGRNYQLVNNNKDPIAKSLITLENVIYNGEMRHNIFSITDAIQKGAKVKVNKKGIEVKYQGNTIFFDYKINTKGGFVFAAVIKPIGVVEETLIKRRVRITADKAHRVLHKSDQKCRATMQSLNYHVVGKFQDKECCLKAKIKRKPISKEAIREIYEPGEALAVDSSSPGQRDRFKFKYASFKKDLGTGMLFVDFTKQKKDIKDDLHRHCEYVKEKFGFYPKVIRMDGAGENGKFKREFSKKSPHTVWQLTGKETPEYNASIEVDIAEIWRMVIATNEANGTPKHKRYFFWSDNVKHNVNMNNMVVNKKEKKCNTTSTTTGCQNIP